MDINEVLRQLVQQIDHSLGFPIFRRNEASIDEVVFEYDLDDAHYYLVRSRPQANYLPDLSPREQTIVQLVAQGLPNKVIGEQLGISHWTVATHLRRIYKKLGVTSRTAMIARLIESMALT
ncbi:MAG: response regulator transcription factor [Microcoleaceae cyanobacterium]